jgi:hypothetical protein
MPIEKKPASPLPKGARPGSLNPPYKVTDADSLETVARKFSVSVTALIQHNFATMDPAEINWYLREQVGCNKPTADGKNWCFSSSAKPGLMYIPSGKGPSEEPAAPTRHLYFAIYYWSADDAFKRAAATWSAMAQSRMNKSQDQMVLVEVRTESAFKAKWDLVYQMGNQPGWKVAQGRLFTHASKGSRRDGLEFEPGDDDGTLVEGEIRSLPKLNWSDDGTLVLHGCNTGISMQRGWNPAEVFAQTQGVETVGQAGYAYFSKQQWAHDTISASDRTIYLWAYARGQNDWGWNSPRIPGITFRP